VCRKKLQLLLKWQKTLRTWESQHDKKLASCTKKTHMNNPVYSKNNSHEQKKVVYTALNKYKNIYIEQ